MNCQKIYDYVRLIVLTSVLLVLSCVVAPFMLAWYACALIGFPVVCIVAMFYCNDVNDFMHAMWRVYCKPWHDFVHVLKDALG